MVKPLEATSLSVTIQGKAIVRELTWAAQRGKINAILGPNGAGKSTFLKALAGLLPFDGHAFIEGQPLAGRSRDALAQEMAWVPQESGLQLSLPVRALVSQGRFAHLGALGRLSATDHDHIDQALEDVTCTHLAHRDWMTLSGGERRRVMIARALCTGAKILLLDEPTASLDIEHALRVMTLMQDLAQRGYTLVPVLHDLALSARFADHVLLIQQGRSAYQGTPDEVLQPAHILDVYGVHMRSHGGMSFQLPEES